MSRFHPTAKEEEEELMAEQSLEDLSINMFGRGFATLDAFEVKELHDFVKFRIEPKLKMLT